MSFVSNFKEIFYSSCNCIFYWKFTLMESDYILQWPWKMGRNLFWNCIFCVHFVIVWTGCKIWSLGMCRIKQLFKVWSLKETQHTWLFFSLSLLPSSFAFLTLSCIFIMGVFGSMLIVFFFCLFLWAFLTVVCSFWFGLKDFFTLHS